MNASQFFSAFRISKRVTRLSSSEPLPTRTVVEVIDTTEQAQLPALRRISYKEADVLSALSQPSAGSSSAARFLICCRCCSCMRLFTRLWSRRHSMRCRSNGSPSSRCTASQADQLCSSACTRTNDQLARDTGVIVRIHTLTLLRMVIAVQQGAARRVHCRGRGLTRSYHQLKSCLVRHDEIACVCIGAKVAQPRASLEWHPLL